MSVRLEKEPRFGTASSRKARTLEKLPSEIIAKAKLEDPTISQRLEGLLYSVKLGVNNFSTYDIDALYSLIAYLANEKKSYQQPLLKRLFKIHNFFVIQLQLLCSNK